MRTLGTAFRKHSSQNYLLQTRVHGFCKLCPTRVPTQHLQKGLCSWVHRSKQNIGLSEIIESSLIRLDLFGGATDCWLILY